MIGTAQHIMATEGPYAFARGVQAAAARAVLNGGIRLGLYNPIKDAISSMSSGNSSGGGSAGLGMGAKLAAGEAGRRLVTCWWRAGDMACLWLLQVGGVQCVCVWGGGGGAAGPSWRPGATTQMGNSHCLRHIARPQCSVLVILLSHE
jgi:hypothetical protein